MTQFQWDPDRYLPSMLAEVGDAYLELQEQTAAATEGVDAARILELGVGTGETARRVLERHRDAQLVGIDASPEMLACARELLPGADLRLSRLEDPLPRGPFDLVVSALVVHHLDGAGKRDLFRGVAAVLRPGGRFVLGDVVVPERAEDSVIEIDWEMDLPDRLDDQLAWLGEAGFRAQAIWAVRDLAVVRADR